MLHAKVQLLNSSDVIRLKQKQDWMFWLARRPVIKAAADITKNLFIYQTGKAQNEATWMSVGDGYDNGRQDAQVPLYQLIASPKSEAGLVCTVFTPASTRNGAIWFGTIIFRECC